MAGSPFSRTTAALAADGHRPTLVWLGAATLVLAAWAAWMWWARLDVWVVTPSGRVEVARQPHQVQSPVSGEVARSELVLGRSVRKGEVLVVLDSRSQQLRLAQQRALVAGLRRRIEAQEVVVAAQSAALKAARAAARAALDEAKAKESTSRAQADYSKERADRLEKLVRGGHVAVLDQLEATAKARGEKARLDELRKAARHVAASTRSSEGDRQVELARLRADIASLRAQLGEAVEAIKPLEHAVAQRRILCPVDGTLAAVTALQPGAFVKSGQSLFTVLPAGTLRAVAQFAPSLAMGRIRVGQRARMRLSGFPWIQYGTVPARVQRVAREPGQQGMRVELSLGGHPRGVPLQHGLPATVEVAVDQVSPAVLVLRAAGVMLDPPPPTGRGER